jgi:S-DNA-T family DNA segregation ATPase FtsK/SpoIIIE
LRTVLAGATACSPPEELHVHVLDHGGGALAADAVHLPHAGTCIGGTDAFRTVRLLDRLGQEVATRRAGAGDGARMQQPPRLLLLVDSVESLMAQLDEYDPQGGSAALLRLVRDGAAVGLTCVLTADRAVPGSRIAAAAQHRLVLPLPDAADYAVAGIRPGAVPRHRPPGRALLADEAECQLALPLPLAAPAASGDAPSGSRGALRIVELPADPPLPQVPSRGYCAGRRLVDGALPVVLGPGGDEGHALVLDLAATGGLLVVGPPGSGRSATLAALAEQLRERAARILRLAPGRAATGAEDVLDPRDTDGIAAWLAAAGREHAVIVADDVGAAPGWPGLAACASAASPGRRGPVLLAAGGAADLAGHYQGPLASLRRSRQGLLLCPGPAEADLLGVRLPRTPLPVRPGSGWLAGPSGLQRVQVARQRSS